MCFEEIKVENLRFSSFYSFFILYSLRCKDLKSLVLCTALGVYQIVKRRSLRLVDRRLFVLGGLYAAVIFCFIVFEIFPVNFRPVLTEGELEASFPSSHVLIALPILLSAADEVNRRIRCLPLRVALVSLILLIVIMLPIGRLLSGVHWFTDIVGGALLALALTLGYFAALSHLDK